MHPIARYRWNSGYGEGWALYSERLADDLGFSFGWGAVYFTVLTALWDGQTLGKRWLGIRVVSLRGAHVAQLTLSNLDLSACRFAGAHRSGKSRRASR